jgi:hypothetical protein
MRAHAMVYSNAYNLEHILKMRATHKIDIFVLVLSCKIIDADP